jgi:hypothetical protein
MVQANLVKNLIAMLISDCKAMLQLAYFFGGARRNNMSGNLMH